MSNVDVDKLTILLKELYDAIRPFERFGCAGQLLYLACFLLSSLLYVFDMPVVAIVEFFLSEAWFFAGLLLCFEGTLGVFSVLKKLGLSKRSGFVGDVMWYFGGDSGANPLSVRDWWYWAVWAPGGWLGLGMPFARAHDGVCEGVELRRLRGRMTVRWVIGSRHEDDTGEDEQAPALSSETLSPVEVFPVVVDDFHDDEQAQDEGAEDEDLSGSGCAEGRGVERVREQEESSDIIQRVREQEESSKRQRDEEEIRSSVAPTPSTTLSDSATGLVAPTPSTTLSDSATGLVAPTPSTTLSDSATGLTGGNHMGGRGGHHAHYSLVLFGAAREVISPSSSAGFSISSNNSSNSASASPSLPKTGFPPSSLQSSPASVSMFSGTRVLSSRGSSSVSESSRIEVDSDSPEPAPSPAGSDSSQSSDTVSQRELYAALQASVVSPVLICTGGGSSMISSPSPILMDSPLQAVKNGPSPILVDHRCEKPKNGFADGDDLSSSLSSLKSWKGDSVDTCGSSEEDSGSQPRCSPAAPPLLPLLPLLRGRIPGVANPRCSPAPSWTHTPPARERGSSGVRDDSSMQKQFTLEQKLDERHRVQNFANIDESSDDPEQDRERPSSSSSTSSSSSSTPCSSSSTPSREVLKSEHDCSDSDKTPRNPAVAVAVQDDVAHHPNEEGPRPPSSPRVKTTGASPPTPTASLLYCNICLDLLPERTGFPTFNCCGKQHQTCFRCCMQHVNMWSR